MAEDNIPLGEAIDLSMASSADSGTARRLAKEHWAYVESILLQQLEVVGKMYRDAMIHGIKHGIEIEREHNANNRTES